MFVVTYFIIQREPVPPAREQAINFLTGPGIMATPEYRQEIQRAYNITDEEVSPDALMKKLMAISANETE